MKDNCVNRILLGIIAVLLLLNFAQGLFSTNTAVADDDDDNNGRYQISAWAAQTGTGYHHSGYYVLDTVTGKVVDSKSEAHSSKE